MADIRELVEGYTIEQDAKGITAQRVFIVDSDATQNGDAPTLPTIGEPLEEILYKNCYCIKQTVKYASADKRKKVYTFSYSNEPIDNSNILVEGNNATAPTDPASLPQQIDYSGEFQLWVPDKSNIAASKWVWEDVQTEKVLTAIPFKIRSFTKKVQRIIPETNYAAFTANIQDSVGKVNSEIVISTLSGGVGCWLFVGASSELFRDQQDRRAYRFDLTFVYRDPDDTDNMGWQKILDAVGNWRIPWNPDNSPQGYIYQFIDFNNLFDDNV